MSIMCFMCGLRYKINEGLNHLRDVKPAGETYMHVGIKEVSLQSEIYRSTNNWICWVAGIWLNVCFFWKALNQIQKQPTKSSSIILALTDGKLAVYVHELTVKQVRFILLNTLFLLMFSLFFLPVGCHLHVFDLQADEARKYGARVYCVGIKDFDEQQVREL